MIQTLLSAKDASEKALTVHRYRYELCGLAVASDLPLSVPPVDEPTLREPSLSIRLMTSPVEAWLSSRGRLTTEVRCDCQIHQGSVTTRLWEGKSGYWIWNESVATFHVPWKGERVDVYPEFGADQRAIADTLCGEVIAFVLHRRGYPCLHASAIVTAEGALAFLGPSGMGKSTLAASFLREGFALLTDDILPLQVQSDGVYAVPGPSTLKLWPETVEHTLGYLGELPKVLEPFDKRLLTLGEGMRHAQSPIRLRGLYLLDRFDPETTGSTDVSIEKLGKAQASLSLLRHTYPGAFVQPAEAGDVFPTYARLAAQTPISVLRYPAGFSYQGEVRRQILADIVSR